MNCLWRQFHMVSRITIWVKKKLQNDLKIIIPFYYFFPFNIPNQLINCCYWPQKYHAQKFSFEKLQLINIMPRSHSRVWEIWVQDKKLDIHHACCKCPDLVALEFQFYTNTRRLARPCCRQHNKYNIQVKTRVWKLDPFYTKLLKKLLTSTFN